MKRSELIDNIFKDLDKTMTKNQILSVIHLAEAYGMLPPDDKNEVFGWNEGFISPPQWEPEEPNTGDMRFYSPDDGDEPILLNPKGKK